MKKSGTDNTEGDCRTYWRYRHNESRGEVTGLVNQRLIDRFTKLVPAIVLILIMVAGCDRGPNSPGWDYFPDMVYSPAYRTWSDNPVLEGEMTMLTPVEGTIPRERIPFGYQRTPEDQERAGRELLNPFSASPVVTDRGRNVYSVYCMLCHGEKGDGQGHLFTTGRYLVPPSSLIDERVTNLPDGAIYHTISVGYGVMAEHGSLIRPEDRWRAILYIREFNKP